MSLTSTTFVAALAVAVVAAVATTLLLWGRARGPVWFKAMQRLGLVVVCQVLAIGLAGTWVNNYYGLYSSWNDLLGRTSSTRLSMAGPPPQRARFTRSEWGMESTYLRGPRSGLASQVYVWLPPQYHERAYRNTGFPVVMLLHGVPGSPESWMTGGGMPGRVASYIAGGIVHPVILVVPSIDPGGVDTDCSDTSRAHTATWLADDVPDLIRQRFRTERSPRAWAVMGLSTGGLCALKLPLQYPKVFAIGAAMSPDPVVGDPTVIGDTSVRVANSPVELAKRRADVRLWAGTGGLDAYSTPANIATLRQAIRPPTTLAPTVVVPQSGHNPHTWAQLEPVLFAWLDTVQDPPELLRAPSPRPRSGDGHRAVPAPPAEPARRRA